jgi:site-specific recombinase XerD
MSNDDRILIDKLKDTLTKQQYNPVVIHNHCLNASYFLCYLAEREITLKAVTSADVSSYLRIAVRRFCKRHGHPPAFSWISIPRAGIHALLRHELKRWPPEHVPTDPHEIFCWTVCREYQEWLSVERGLAAASIDALMWEARHFCAWYIGRADTPSFKNLSIRDVDAYLEMRASGLRRKSVKDVVERLRSLIRHLHRTSRTVVDLTPQIIAPVLYAYESIPSALSLDQIETVLEFARKNRSPMGLRSYAILQLLATYGLRSGEITHLRLDDIDWHVESLRIRHSKTGAQSLLPLMVPVGEALIDYLQYGRPKTDAREIFIRSRAPYRPVSGIYNEVRRCMEAAGVKPNGKRGPHIFRHARAVSLLRAAVPRKIIGDVLGHQSSAGTIPYLKLATEDLRAIALEIPGQEVRS